MLKGRLILPEQRSAEEIYTEVGRLLNAGNKVQMSVPLPVPLALPSGAFNDREATDTPGPPRLPG